MDHFHRLIAFAALLFASSLAFAHTPHVCTTPSACDAGQAFEEATAHADWSFVHQGSPSGWQACVYEVPNAFVGATGNLASTCQASATMAATSFYGDTCADRDVIERTMWSDGPMNYTGVMCYGGCAYSYYADSQVCFTINNEENADISGCSLTIQASPTGETCDSVSPDFNDSGDPPDDGDPNEDDPPDCNPVDSSQCIDDNGDPLVCAIVNGQLVCVPAGNAGPPPDSDGDGSPDPNDPDPNDPGLNDPTDSDGDGIPDQRDPYPNDPNNGTGTSPPAAGGEPVDPDADNVASGGGTCGAAPSCSGDGIACAILFQQWKARCEASERFGVAGGTDTDDLSGVVGGQGTDLLGELGGPVGGGAGSCPEPPTFNAFGAEYTLPFTDVLCPLFAIVGPLIIFGAYVAAARIVLE